jgi:hypothetical protein
MKQKSLAWLCSLGLKGEMESLILAAQDQALNMRYHQRNMKQSTNSKRRMCYNAEENIRVKHIVQGCTILMLYEYINRHNKVAGYIHWTVCKRVGLHFTDRYHGHIPERVINVSGTAIMWDVPAVTDRKILANRTDIVSMIKKKTCLLIDIALLVDSNVNTKENEKLSKLKRPGDQGK